MTRPGWTVTIGIATGLVGLVGLAFTLDPFVSALEDSIGLRWLFRARGAIAPPSGVAIVSIDEVSGPAMDLPRLVRDWPRSTHARLVDRLVHEGASAIAFDIEFFEHGDPDDDGEFGRSIARSRRVVLVQRVDRMVAGDHEAWERKDPIPPLVAGTLGLAPVPIPALSGVTWIWSFHRTPITGDAPTLPAVALQVHALPFLGQFLDLLRRAGVEGLESLPRTAADIQEPTDLPRLMQVLRERIGVNHSVVSRMVAASVTDAQSELGPDASRALLALTDLYTGSAKRYLNFYGPPGSLCTIPYEVALGGAPAVMPCSLEGAVVFVGMGNARVGRPGQPDTYSTVYRDSDGIDFSGVEIHATAFANLMTGTGLRSLGPGTSITTLMALGALLGGGGYWIRTRRRRLKGPVISRVQGAGFVFAAAAAYCAVAYLCFRQYHAIIPLIVPLAAQLPAALILGLLAPTARHEEQVRAVCLATDAGGSTAIGQRLPHERYAQLMGAYHQALSDVVRKRRGELVPPEGDGFVALWCGPPLSRSAEASDKAMRLEACLAALELADAADHFNRQQLDDQRLPTRIGLHVGAVTIHSDADRGVFRVLGDTVNVASRLCDLNVGLGTQVLASTEVTAGLERMLRLRSVHDSFSLKGVARTPVVCELVRTMLAHTRSDLQGACAAEVESHP